MSDAAALSRQRCFHHPAREAVCRCTGCSRPFCRECVVDHDGRLVCTACLAERVSGPRASGRGRRVKAIATGATGFLLAWVFFYSAVKLLLGIMQRWNDWGTQ
jgi:hypothetical protein